MRNTGRFTSQYLPVAAKKRRSAAFKKVHTEQNGKGEQAPDR
jgi:hypothetical protein